MKTLAKYHICNHCVIGEKTFKNILIGPGKLPGLSRNGPQAIALRLQENITSCNSNSVVTSFLNCQVQPILKRNTTCKRKEVERCSNFHVYARTRLSIQLLILVKFASITANITLSTKTS